MYRKCSPPPKSIQVMLVVCFFFVIFGHTRCLCRYCAKTVCTLFSSSLFCRIFENTRIRRKPPEHCYHAVHQGFGAGWSRRQYIAEDAVPILPEPVLFRVRRHHTGRAVQTIQRRSVLSRRIHVQIQINVRCNTRFRAPISTYFTGNWPLLSFVGIRLADVYNKYVFIE